MEPVLKTLTASVQWNEHGCPFVDALPGSRVEISVHRAVQVAATAEGLPPQSNQVCIAGNRAGLAALGAWLLALANEASILDHQHFDNEVSFGFYRSAQ